MKYISGAFDWRLSATVYLQGFNFSKQISVLFSTIAGKCMSSIGLKKHIFSSVLVLVVTVVGCDWTKSPDKE